MGSSWRGIQPVSPALVGRFFTLEPAGKPHRRFLNVMFYWWIDLFVSIKCSLFLGTIYSWKSSLSGISIATFFFSFFSHGICLFFYFQPICDFKVSHRRYIVGLRFYIYFVNLCLLIGVFSIFTFNEITDKAGLWLPFCYLFSLYVFLFVFFLIIAFFCAVYFLL